jgi:hypothetical protein
MARFGRNFAPVFLPPPHGLAPKAHQYGPLTLDPATAVAPFHSSSFSMRRMKRNSMNH